MRLVLDTNVVASGLLWNGTPARLIDAAQSAEIEVFTSRVLLAELTRILRRAKFAKAIAASRLSLDDLVLGYAEIAQLVQPTRIAPVVITDPDDDHVLACAIAARADLIISGDSDLLNLNSYQGIQIVSPSEAMMLLSPR
jgi:uncharacterized protein